MPKFFFNQRCGHSITQYYQATPLKLKAKLRMYTVVIEMTCKIPGHVSFKLP